jgi:hypothetical protein
MKRSTRHRLQTPQRGLYAYGLSYLAGTRGLHRRRSWRTRGMVALMLSGLLLMGAAVFGTSIPSRGAYKVVPQVVQQTREVMVQDETLPPVLQRIAQCESHGQHWTRHGTILRGTRNRHDTGLFQINTLVWGKKAQELGYDLRTPEGNAHMARFLFAHYGSVPWQSSAACWNRAS